MAKHSLTLGGFGLRLLFALLLVFLTYNPEGYSYNHWALLSLPDISPIKAFIGVALLIAWVIYLRATLHSLGALGLVLATAFFGTLIWVLVSSGLVPADSARSVAYIVETVLCLVLAIGISWSHVRRRMTGQLDVDDADE